MNKAKQIPIKCKGNRYLPYHKLKDFQGNLKEMSKENYRKLRALILKHGWIAPVFVWNGNEMLDGHGRLKVLGELIKEGYTIGDIPIVDIEAKDKQEAAKILLSINSHFQRITDEGLYEFISGVGLQLTDLEAFQLNDIDLGEFKANFFETEEPELPITAKLYESYNYVLIYTTNVIDAAFLENFFDLKPHRSYKSRKVSITRVVSFEKFLEQLEKYKCGS